MAMADPNAQKFCTVCERTPDKCICHPRDPQADQFESLRNRVSDEEQERAQGSDITLAKQRQAEAQELASKVFGAARELAAKGMLVAVGYRALVKPIESTLGLEDAEAQIAPTLAADGFQVKTDGERKREERGENHGVVISLGPIAFERMGGRGMWCDEGDLVVFSRYAGTRVEHPPGSGTFYQLMNDEDIFGKVL